MFSTRTPSGWDGVIVWTCYPPKGIDYAGDASVGAAENGNAVFDSTKRRGGKVLGWRRGAYKPSIVGQNSHDVGALRYELAKVIGEHRLWHPSPRRVVKG